MNYYIDTEFLEGTQKKRLFGMPFGDTPPTIDLISIGIVSEDGSEYYAISNEFNVEEAWFRYDTNPDFSNPNGLRYTKNYWIRDNVLMQIYQQHVSGDMRNVFPFTLKTMKWIVKSYGKSRMQIAADIKTFCLDNKYPLSRPYFYGYYSDYDWVAFCWLFGKMIDLPNRFPMYCIDLKQELDSKLSLSIFNKENTYIAGEIMELKHLPDVETRINWLENNSIYYPKQTNEHHALADARWNKKLHEFINRL